MAHVFVDHCVLFFKHQFGLQQGKLASFYVANQGLPCPLETATCASDRLHVAQRASFPAGFGDVPSNDVSVQGSLA
jgi:hypothetical protein